MSGLSFPKPKQKHFEALFFIFLFLFSFVFARERIINSDAAFYFFKIVNFEHFNTEHGRYSAFISQIPLLAGVKAGVNLNVLVYLYSLSFIFLFWLVYLLIRHGLKNPGAALALVMVISVGVTDSIYRPVSESTQGLVYTLILFSVLYYPFPRTRPKWRDPLRITLSAVVIILCYFAHPLTIFPVLFIIGFFMIDRHEWKNYVPWILIMFTVILFSFRFLFLTAHTSSYEGGKLSGMQTISGNLPHFFELYSTKYLAKHLFSTYLVSTVLFVILNVYYLARKEFLKWILTMSFVLGFILIYNVDYYSGGSNIEMDKNLMVMNYLVFLPFAADVYQNRKLRPWLKGSFLILILVFAMITILARQEPYKKRIRYYLQLNDVLQNQDGKKFYTSQENISPQVLFLWAVPFESLIISSLDGPEYSKTIYPFADIENLPSYISDPRLFLCTTFWPRWQTGQLNERYFRLPEEPYRYLPGEVLEKTNP